MNNLEILFGISIGISIAIILVLVVGLVEERDEALNNYHDCVIEQNHHHMPLEEAWKFYEPQCNQK